MASNSSIEYSYEIHPLSAPRGMRFKFTGHGPTLLLVRSAGRSSIASLALLIWAMFVVAGVFVAEVASRQYEGVQVLMKSGNCGTLTFNQSTSAGFAAWESRMIKENIKARNYASNWYSENSSSIAAATLFPAQRLSYNVSLTAPCPFGNRCLLGDNAALTMDTGMLSSYHMFGINAPPQDRINYRKVVTCSPVRVDDLVEEVNGTAESANDVSLRYWLGPVAGTQNYTYAYDVPTSRAFVGYQLYSVHYRAYDTDRSWDPVDAFKPPDADVSVLFLAQNSMRYLEPVFDPFFSANGTHIHKSGVSGPLGVLIAPDNNVTVLGCAERSQICNPINGSCTRLGGDQDYDHEASTIGLNGPQSAAAKRLYSSTISPSIHRSVLEGAPALRAQEQVSVTAISAGLPPNQWQLECQRWFESSLALMQAETINFPARTDLEPYVSLRPAANYTILMSAQCSNQRIRSTGTVQSFSFLGVMLVVCISAMFLTMHLTMDWCVRRYRKRYPSPVGHEREVARMADDKIQLLRMALEGAGYDEWIQGKRDIPATPRGAVFAGPVLINGLPRYQKEQQKRQVVQSPRSLTVHHAPRDEDSQSLPSYKSLLGDDAEYNVIELNHVPLSPIVTRFVEEHG